MSAKMLREIVAIEGHACVPSRIEGLREEDTVTGPNYSLLVHGVGKADAWSEALLPRHLRVFLAVAGVSTTGGAGKSKPSWNSGGGIDTHRVKEREMIV